MQTIKGEVARAAATASKAMCAAARQHQQRQSPEWRGAGPHDATDDDDDDDDADEDKSIPPVEVEVDDEEAEAEGGGGEGGGEPEAEGAERWERDVHRATDQMPDEATEADEAGDAAPSILVVIAGAPEDAGKGPKVHQVSIARTDTSALGNPFVAPRLRDAVEANELQRQATAAHAEWLRMLSVPAGRVSDGPDGDAVILNGEGLPFDPRIAPRTGAWKRMTGQQQVDAVRGALRERGDKTTLL